MEVPPRLELGVELLQSSALPLGYGTDLILPPEAAPDREPIEAGRGRKGGATERYEVLRRPPKGTALKRRERSLLRRGASDEARTRYLHLGKVALYQMS